MGLFNFFKKNEQEEPHYDPTNIRVADLEKNYLFDYDFETWTVLQMSEYDWGENYFSREFLVASKGKKRYLHIEDDDGIIVSFTEKMKIRKLGEAVMDHIDSEGKPPKKITYQGIVFYLDEEAPGYYRDVATENWEAFVAFNYLDEDEQQCLTIEQWDDNDFEAYLGIIIPENKITNILPINNE